MQRKFFSNTVLRSPRKPKKFPCLASLALASTEGKMPLSYPFPKAYMDFRKSFHKDSFFDFYNNDTKCLRPGTGVGRGQELNVG